MIMATRINGGPASYDVHPHILLATPHTYTLIYTHMCTCETIYLCANEYCELVETTFARGLQPLLPSLQTAQPTPTPPASDS